MFTVFYYANSQPHTVTQLSIIVCYRSMNITRSKCCYIVTLYRVDK